jgi:hypothetical protein
VYAFFCVCVVLSSTARISSAGILTIFRNIYLLNYSVGALCYKPEDCGFESR